MRRASAAGPENLRAHDRGDRRHPCSTLPTRKGPISPSCSETTSARIASYPGMCPRRRGRSRLPDSKRPSVSIRSLAITARGRPPFRPIRRTIRSACAGRSQRPTSPSSHRPHAVGPHARRPNESSRSGRAGELSPPPDGEVHLRRICAERSPDDRTRRPWNVARPRAGASAAEVVVVKLGGDPASA